MATADAPASRGPGPAGRSAHFPTFEGLRALCALAILAYHAGTFTGLTWGRTASFSGVGPWIQHLDVGVSIFFVLSGFLLFRPFVRAHLADDPSPRVGRYLVRRLVRIFPAYWLALAMATWLLHLQLGDWWGHVRFYGLLQIYWGPTALGGLVQAWSLCTELSFYLFLPLWAAALSRVGGSVTRRTTAHYVGCAVLYVAGIAFRAELRAGHHAIGYAWLPANCDLFALGMALAVAHASSSVRGGEPGALLRTLGDLPGAAWAAALCCYAGVVALHYPYGFDPPTVVQEASREVLFGLVAVLVVAPGVFGAQDRGAIRRALRWRPLWALGVVSYGIYLWHLTVIERLVPHLGGQAIGGVAIGSGLGAHPPLWLLVVVASAITAGVAAVSWFALERPLLRWVRSGAAFGGERARVQSGTADALGSPPESAPACAPQAGHGAEERT